MEDAEAHHRAKMQKRKAVHDALAQSTSVVTRSEGEEPRRFVVVAPA